MTIRTTDMCFIDEPITVGDYSIEQVDVEVANERTI